MRYLHSMIRIRDFDETLDFFCNKLGFKEVRRYDSEAGKYTNVFLAAPDDFDKASKDQSPLVELTYNWPDENGTVEEYIGGRNFGHLAFEVDDIYKTCQKLMDAGVTINRPPRDGRMAFIKTPDGISIELLQKENALPEAEPWKSMENDGPW